MATPSAPRPSRRPDYRAADALRALVDVACFFVELAMLVLLAASGWRLGDGGLIGIALAVLYPALAIIIWALYLARTAEKRLRNPSRLIVQLVLFAASTVAAVAGDLEILGVVFAVVSVVTFGLSALLGETPLGGSQAGSRSSSA